jgi:CRISPR-associated protein Cas2
MYKIMRVVVLFDLPTNTKQERRNATRFRNFLLDDGFDMLQYSIYSRLCPDRDNANTHLERVKNHAPDDGSIRLLMLTEQQFTNMHVITGEKTVQEKLVGYQQLAFF